MFSSDVGILEDEDDGDWCWRCQKPLPTWEEDSE